MKTVLLFVTWFITGQPPSSYQAEFSSAESCKAARDLLIDDAHRLIKGGSPEGGHGATNDPKTAEVHTIIPLPPLHGGIQLSVVCAPK
ncbi:MAG: hypothetical protein ACLQFI_02325 [Methylocella sp.]